MLSVAGGSQLKAFASYPPEMDSGKTVLGSAADGQQSLALGTCWQENPMGWFQAVERVKWENETRCRNDGWSMLLCVCHKGVGGLGAGREGLLRSSSWICFWSAARRISLRESCRISCPVVALLLMGCARWSLCNGLTLLVWGFSHFLFYVGQYNCSLEG